MPESGAKEAAAIVAAALRHLARREFAQLELQQRLVRQGFAPEDIEPVLADLASRGWLSDSRYCAARTRSRVRKGQGPLLLERDWRQAGVDRELAQTEISAVDWLDLARETLIRRFGAAPPKDHREQAKRARFLQARGFPPALIQRLLRDPLAD